MSVLRSSPSLAAPPPPDGSRASSPDAVSDDAPPILIEASRGGLSLGLADIWAFRELLFLLSWRDVKVRYKQTALGFGWAIIPPLMTMVVFSVVFGGFAKIPSDGLPYPLFSYSGLLPWLFFSQGVMRGGASLVANSGLISKVYFPRIIVPLSGVLTPLADLGFSLVVLAGLMAWYDVGPGWGILAFPGLIVLALATSLAVSVWLSALNVKYRDVGFAMTFLLQFWMYASPVIYPASSVPHRLRLLYGLNPMTGVVDGFRWGLFSKAQPDFGLMGVSVAVVAILLVTGLVYFKRAARTIVDVL